MQKITPFLWFDNQAEQAAKFYASVFKKSKILDIARYTEGSPGKPGSVMTVKFRLEGQEFAYDTPGLYFPTLTVTDPSGAVHTATALVEVVNRAALDTLLQAKWLSMRDALRRGDAVL